MNPSGVTRECDVVVVGGGIAGLSAAVSSAEAGASVLLLERSVKSETGGNTRYTEAYMRMKSIDEPADGLAEALVDDFMGHPDPSIMVDVGREYGHRSALLRAHHVVDLDYVETLVAQAGPTLRWLTGHGLTFAPLPTLFPTVSTKRLAPVGGGLALVEALGKRARELGVEFLFETTARSLVVADSGAVAGVRTRGEVGPGVVSAKAVVLACGGYQGSNEMMARYHGPRALTCRPVARGGNYNKGEGIEMALAIGAASAGNFALFHAEPVDPRSGEPEAAVMALSYGILVNAEGRRFVDEARGPVDAWYERITRDIQAQTGGIAWLVLDASSKRVPTLRSGIRTNEPPVKADSITELAGRLGIDAGTLGETVAAYNSACDPDGPWDPSTPDGLATTGLNPPKSNWAKAIAERPFEAYPVMAANVFTFGGLKVDAASRVIDRDGRALPGLFAAGEMTGLYYSNYTGSTSVLRGAVFGRIAGTNAAVLAGRRERETV
jgi:tricarballylate dehydrogenase